MPTVVPHLKPEEVLERYHKAREAIGALRWLAVYHALRGSTAKEVARRLHRSLRWVHLVLARYHRESPGALPDGRHPNPGRKSKLSREES
ncbi:helix-turn-helix domain-containing protein [Thermus altitudinis]|uniref:helix-turn-helix domain-containing protein n=1 Tax=Thermus altitudinis TaxID=2908145 RepID=UPI001FAA23B6|nr:helix-turn-helix domain-containing protein [Thermus altitudinis]